MGLTFFLLFIWLILRLACICFSLLASESAKGPRPLRLLPCHVHTVNIILIYCSQSAPSNFSSITFPPENRAPFYSNCKMVSAIINLTYDQRYLRVRLNGSSKLVISVRYNVYYIKICCIVKSIPDKEAYIVANYCLVLTYCLTAAEVDTISLGDGKIRWYTK